MTTFGVELEFCSSVPIRSFVSTLQKMKISILYVDPKQPTALYWKAEKDLSVICKGPNRFGSSLKTFEKKGHSVTKFPIELVSPVLTNIKSLSSFLKKMHSMNVSFSTNQTQGFHIHISNSHLQMPKFSNSSFGTQWVTTFCVNWVVFENVLLDTHRPNRLNSPHARSLRDNIKYTGSEKNFDKICCNDSNIDFDYIHNLFNPNRKNYANGKVYPIGFFHDVNLSDGRNSVVNLSNLKMNRKNRKGTVEIRSHEGTIDPKVILKFVRFMKRFFNACYCSKKRCFVDARILIENNLGKSYKKCNKKDLNNILRNIYL